jgi:nicotinamidase-related amidase
MPGKGDERKDADGLMEAVRGYNLHSSWKVRRSKACLIVVDMQNYFVHPDGDSNLDDGERIVPALMRLIAQCRKVGVPVLFTQHAHKKDKSDLGILGDWWGSAIIEGTWEAEIYEGLRPKKGEVVVRKNRYSAFQGTGLGAKLRRMGIEDVIITGVMTNICCETTAREAFMHDFRVFFLADGTATVGDHMQLATLRNLAYAFAVVKTVEQVIKELG